MPDATISSGTEEILFAAEIEYDSASALAELGTAIDLTQANIRCAVSDAHS